ncbi:MAG: DNA repair protein RecN [Chromatiales bacterium 21-64-14]|nr:MAG: DNA repair protein RecN [Chromatiales bacterium 21-64-14]HQU16167.1 DNA repair protein RecN [Gammaproteobacteria bacterium]
MLTQIQIRDFAIIEALELELAPGLTVLTGETGAGKSILVGAVGLVLGDRSDPDTVRNGAERAEVSAAFDVCANPAARRWLQEQDLESGDECQLRRVVFREGRTRAYINARPVPLQSLKDLGACLVDIHGQHEHQSLLRPDVQRAWLDGFGGHLALARTVDQTYRRWKELDRERTALLESAAQFAARAELLRYQVRELETLALTAEEIPALDDEHRRLANAGRLLETGREALDTLYEDEEASLSTRLNRVLAAIQGLQNLDGHLAGIAEYLENARIQMDEAGSELRRYLDRLDLDPARLRWVDERLATIHDLARKHRVAPEALPALLEQIRAEWQAVEHADQRRDALEQEVAAARDDFEKSARELSLRRAEAGARLTQRISAAMQELGMPGGQFQVELAPLPDGEAAASGRERVEFLVSANPGEPVKALRKVASGGELSRISLAIQVTAVDEGALPSLIFDEVDSGIGGGVAETVGHHLRALGRHHQVLCVTHLPQVASLAHHHLQVTKRSTRQSTHTQIRGLSAAERIGEIARMLGGLEITPQTLAHAEEMIQRAQG